MRLPPIVDIILTAGAAAMTVLLAVIAVDRGMAWYDVADAAVHAGLTVALWFRSTRRRTSFVATYVLLAALAILVHVAPVNLGVSPIILCAPLALYKVARHDPAPWSVAGLLLGIAGSFVSPLNRLPTGGAALFIAWMILIMVVTFLWAAGRRRTELAHAAELERTRAEHERSAELLQDRARAEERTRIAREIHDVVAHSLTVVNVQAATALTIGTEEQMRDSLTGVREASQGALDEVRSLLHALRDEPARDVSGDLSRLPELVTETRSAGVDLTADLPSDDTLTEWNNTVPASSRLALVRVVQESLSNVIKHGGPDPKATLQVSRDDPCEVRVSNDQRGQGDSSGFGLEGLRERVRLVGGTYTAGPDGDGFTITAQIPLSKDATIREAP